MPGLAATTARKEKNMVHSRKLTELVGEYLLAKQNRMAWSTKQLTIRSFRYLTGLTGDIGLEFFTVEHAESFLNHLLDKYSKTTAKIYIKTIRPVFRWALRKKWIEQECRSWR